MFAQEIPYTLKRYKQSKTIRIRVSRTGEISVTAPLRTSLVLISGFVKENQGWISKQLSKHNSLPPKIMQLGDEKEYKLQKAAALKLCENLINHYNKLLNVSYSKISIRNQSSRWGSCSSKKNLSFNWRIVLLPDHVARYLVVHELCHLKEMNHSQRFWSLVESIIPDARAIDDELKKL